MGRWVDHLPRSAEDMDGYTPSGVTTNQFFVSVLQAFGFSDESFGGADGVAQGPVPGLR